MHNFDVLRNRQFSLTWNDFVAGILRPLLSQHGHKLKLHEQNSNDYSYSQTDWNSEMATTWQEGDDSRLIFLFFAPKINFCAQEWFKYDESFFEIELTS